MAAAGVASAWTAHRLLPAVPMLTAAIVLGVAAAHLPGSCATVRGVAQPGLSFAGKRLMRAGFVPLGLSVGLDDVLGLGWETVAMVLCAPSPRRSVARCGSAAGWVCPATSHC